MAKRAQNLIRFFIVEENEREKERKRRIIFGKRTMRADGTSMCVPTTSAQEN